MYLRCIIIITFFTLSCSERDSIPDNQIPQEPLQTEFTYLALGDSYTIGEDVEEQFRWPNQLRDSITQTEFTLTQVDIIAKTGWTTTNLLNAIATENPKRYDLVSLLIGVNNQFQSKPFDLFTSEFDSLINISKSLSIANKLFVVSIPDYGVTPFGSSNAQQIAEELDEYNNHMREYCEERLIPFIDITQISRDLGNSQDALASDNLHPSGKQYSKWVNKMVPIVVELLK